MEVLICTGDRDAFQLVSDTTTVLYPRKGVSDLVRMTPTAIEDKYGVSPDHYPDIAALVGETSDNLPGVPGVGPKTAAKWINSYGTLDALVADVDAIPGKAGESLRDHIDDVLRNRRINALICDLELPAKPDDLAFTTEWNRNAIHEVFDALEFAALRERLFDYLGGGDESATPDAAADLTLTQVAPGELSAWLTEHTRDVPVGLEVVGVTRPVDARAEYLALATGSGTAAWVTVSQLDADDDKALGSWLSDADQPKVLHDAKGQAHALAAQGWALSGVVADTALATYLIKPDQRAYDLADLSVRYLHRELQSAGDDSGQLTFDDDGGAEVAVQRAHAALELWGVLESELESQASLTLLRDVELPLVDVLLGMEADGIAADTDHLDALHAEFTEQDARRGPGRVRRHRQGGQPRLAQAAAGRAVRRARHAQDEAHQDRLHHRRRLAGGPVRQDRAPVPRAPAGPPRRHAAAADRRRTAEDRRTRRPHPHHVLPDDRRHRPPQLGRPQPAEHPDPHRVGPPDP